MLKSKEKNKFRILNKIFYMYNVTKLNSPVRQIGNLVNVRDFFYNGIVKFCIIELVLSKVQVGKDQEKAQSEKDSHSKNRGGKKPN